MQHIYAYLKIAWQNIIEQHQQNNLFWSFTLLLATIPLSLGINNVILAITSLIFISQVKNQKFQLTFTLALPILLFLLMLLSSIWSIDNEKTISALPKEITLFVIPLFFIGMKRFTKSQTDVIYKYYSLIIVLIVIYWLIRAFVRFVLINDSNVFFYHELVTEDLNAIHVSVYVSIAYFYFLTIKEKSAIQWIFMFLLFGFIVLLSSKNILAILILLTGIYFLKYKLVFSLRQKILGITLFIIVLSLFSGKIIDRYLTEFNSNTSGTSQTIEENNKLGINVLTIKEAWTNDKFTPNDYFTGTAFRVYQIRLFLEFFREEQIFWSGFGFDASFKKLEEKAIKYDVYRGDNLQKGYQSKNFHNQYIQNFVELGVFGFVILILMLVINLKNGIFNKDFLHITFAVLMISLFLTETFLWRQRGVVFFTLMYCIMNTKSLNSNK
jgi:O-antigen ligase